MSKVFSRSEIFFAQLEDSYGIIPNTSGTATVAGSDGMAAIQLKLNRTVDELYRKDKTGSRTRTAGVPGREIASWSVNASLVTSGTPGTLPDHNPFLVSAFGAAATITSGTVAVTGATNASPIVLTATGHGCSDYDVVSVTGILGNTAANAIWCVKALTANTLELIGSTGNAAYVSGGSVSKAGLYYKPTDAEPSVTAWSARVPYATASQRAGFGLVAKELTINLGEDIATFTVNGAGKWVIDNKKFAEATTEQKGGLNAFPDLGALVGSLVTTGTGIAGFRGRAVVNGSTITRIRTASVKYGSAVDLPRDTFGSSMVDDPEADERQVTVDLNMYEDDSDGQAALEQASITKDPIDIILQVGTQPGNTVVCVLRGVHLASPDRDDGQRAFTMNYSGSPAYGSSITGFDEMRLWMV